MRMSRRGHRAQAAGRISAAARSGRAARMLLLASACALAACVYRMPIQQGNYLDPAVIAQVKPGMTHSQVRYLLGTPMVPGAFDTSRWDYDYYLKSKRLKGPGRGHVSIYFTDNLVARIDSNVTSAPFAPVSTRGAQAPEPRSAGGH
ncbi:MAG: outer membrane protein assembly factor BamE [Steroidobacterales bacterium]